MEKTKHILVTGGAGYIGSHTVVELYNSDYIPVILDDFRNSLPSVIQNLEAITGQQIHLVKGACQDTDLLHQIFSKYNFQGVIHFAADKAVGESVQDPLKYYDNNLNSLISILRAMEKFKVKHLVFSSSCSVYGNPELKNGRAVVAEDTSKLNPASPYGNTKLISEQIISDWIASNAGSNVALLRYFNPIGAHHSGKIGELPQGVPNNLLPYITQTALGIRSELTVFGNDYTTEDGTCVRDYIHVSDLAAAHVSSIQWLEKQNLGSVETFNIGTGKGTSVLEIIHAFEKITQQKLNWKFGERRKGDVAEIFANPDKAEKLLNWKSKLTISKAIEDALKWEHNHTSNA